MTRIIGSDWARKYPVNFRDYDPPEPRPCALCGAPKGECTPETGEHRDTETPDHT